MILNGFRELVAAQTGYINFEFIVLDDTICDLETWIDELAAFLRALQYRHVVDLNQLVNVAETGVVFACGNCVANTVAVDLATLTLQLHD